MFRSSLAIRREIGDRRGEGWMQHSLARVAGLERRTEVAVSAAEEARRIAVELGDKELLQACDELNFPTLNLMEK